MIILDTNVLSELMYNERAHPRVIAWMRSLRQQPVTTVINRAEILSGIALLPQGSRRATLHASAEAAFAPLGAVLPLATESAPEYAHVVALRRGRGRPIGARDALIASIARVADAAVATRDTNGFSGLGLDVINPWED